MIDTNSYPDRAIEKLEWTWEAHYLDGTVLKQGSIKDIDHDSLLSIHIVHETIAPVVLMWRQGLKFIHFWRVRIFHTTTEEIRYRLYCFGYQDGDKKTILAFMPDGGIVITDDIDNI
jgi:hypothetical protein